MTRRDVADYLADHLSEGRAKAVDEAAAWLIASRRTRQTPYLVRQVTAALESRSYIVAHITTAHPLNEAAQTDLRERIARLMKADEVELELHVDPAVLGGMRLELPTSELDNTLAHRLRRLAEVGQ